MKDQVLFDTTSATTRSDTDSIGAVLYDAVNDRLGVINASQELEVHDTDVLAQLVSGVTVSATDLDIRDLTHVSDSVKIGDGTDFLAIAADGSIAITDNGGSLTVDASDLDIRDLAHTQDSIRLGDGTSLFTSGTGASDDVATSFQGLDTRSFNYGFDGTNWDRLRATSGALHVDIQDASITVDDVALANTAIAAGTTALTIGGTAEDAVGSPLASRKYLWLYNNDNQKMYIGPNGVSAATGFPISPKSYIEMRAGASVDIEFVSAKTGHDLRYMETS